MSTTKTKVIDISTGQAQKNVENLTKTFVPLRTQIKQLKDELGQLEVGSEEFNRVSKQLADVQQQQIEISEAAKYSNRDFGAVMGSLTKVSMGLVGGINAISASMALLGGDSEKMQKALAPIVLTMSIIQGLSSIDDALKSLEGLKNAFSGLGETAADAAKIETIKNQVESIPDKKTIKIDVDSAGAITELKAVEKAANGVGNAEGNIATKGKLVTTTNKGIASTGKGLSGVLRTVASGFKAAALAVRSFITANPILAAIAAAVAAIAAGIAFLNKKLEENGRVAREEADILSQSNTAYEEQTIRLNVLLQTAKDHNQSLAERKKATEELNKIIPGYNAQLNEETGLYSANSKSLKAYLDNLKQKIQLEAYEGKIKEYLQKQLELEEEINEIQNTGWWRVKARVRDRKEEIKELGNDIDRLYGKISNLDMSKALDENKVAEPVNKGTTKAVQNIKTVIDALKEMKKVASDAWDTVFQARSLDRVSKGFETEYVTLFDTIHSTMKKYDIGQVFTKQFADFINKGSKSDFSAMFKEGFFGLDDVLKNPNIFDKISKEATTLANEITRINDKLSGQTGNLTAAETKHFEKQKKQFETKLENLNNELESYRKVAEGVEKYRDAMIELSKEALNREIEQQKLNKQLEIQKKYREEILNGNYFAESNRNIATQESEIDILTRLNEKLEERVEILKSDKDLQLLFADEIKAIDEQILANKREIDNKEIELDINKYDRRKEEAQIYYEELEKLIGGEVEKLENRNILRGLGTPAHNTEFQKQKLVVETIQSEMEALEKSRSQNLIAEEEYNARMLQLKSHLNEESEKLDKMRVENSVNAVNTYVNAFSSVTSTIGSLLQEQMNNYDENSEEYKKLQVTNAWLTTLSGTLSAFMSGISSGVPAPFNYILATAMAGMTFAAGASQISNMQSGSHSNALTSSATNIGTGDYETEVYRQQSETLSSVKEQKVYVLENDITRTQNRVAVRESNVTY